MDSDLYSRLAEGIIAQQESIIGPVAVTKAQQVTGLQVDWKNKQVKVSGDPIKIVGNLVDQYKVLFGQISVEVCKEAVKKLPEHLSPEQLPASLR